MSAITAAAVQSKADELSERAQVYCRRKVVEVVNAGSRFVTRLSDEERDLLVLLMCDAWCAGALDALDEAFTKRETERQDVAAQQRELRELSARRRAR